MTKGSFKDRTVTLMNMEVPVFKKDWLFESKNLNPISLDMK